MLGIILDPGDTLNKTNKSPYPHFQWKEGWEKKTINKMYTMKNDDTLTEKKITIKPGLE